MISQSLRHLNLESVVESPPKHLHEQKRKSFTARVSMAGRHKDCNPVRKSARLAKCLVERRLMVVAFKFSSTGSGLWNSHRIEYIAMDVCKIHRLFNLDK
jgi:hypothetical protein